MTLPIEKLVAFQFGFLLATFLLTYKMFLIMTNNTITDEQYIKDSIERAEQSKQDIFDSWIIDLDKEEEPESCDTEDSNCIICGS
tara:strand:- start:203 stop:457 length:255 start_codon:yes stop_codon:yes gene_type:complete